MLIEQHDDDDDDNAVSRHRARPPPRGRIESLAFGPAPLLLVIALTQPVEVVVTEAVVAEVTATGVEEEGFSRPARCHDGRGGPVNTDFLLLSFILLKAVQTY